MQTLNGINYDVIDISLLQRILPNLILLTFVKYHGNMRHRYTEEIYSIVKSLKVHKLIVTNA
jgi:hypothetical protein